MTVWQLCEMKSIGGNSKPVMYIFRRKWRKREEGRRKREQETDGKGRKEKKKNKITNQKTKLFFACRCRNTCRLFFFLLVTAVFLITSEISFLHYLGQRANETDINTQTCILVAVFHFALWSVPRHMEEGMMPFETQRFVHKSMQTCKDRRPPLLIFLIIIIIQWHLHEADAAVPVTTSSSFPASFSSSFLTSFPSPPPTSVPL